MNPDAPWRKRGAMERCWLDNGTRVPLKIAGIYLVVAVLWVLFSDQLVSFFARDPEILTELQTVKGWLFVGGTALFIFVLLRRELAVYQATMDQLRQNEQALRDILDAMPVGVALTDGTTIEYINVNFSERFGYSLDEIATDEQWFLHAYPEPDYREPMIAAWKAELERARTQGTPIRPFEVKVTCKNGTVRQVIANTQLIGKRIMVILTDITERELLQNELIKMQKLESIGVLAGGIAHDFNNILTGIMGNISYAQVLLEPGHPACQPLASAEQATIRAADLTRQLLTFARGGEPIKQVVSVAELIKEAMALMLRGSTVKGETRFDVGLWAIEADAGQISQVFNNMIINAVQAMPQGGTLTIAADNELIAEDSPLSLPTGRYVRVTIADEGCGMEPDVMGRIFDPYFSTKGTGSGLGLASAYSIVTRHAGALEVDSVVGQGTTFTLHLPASDTQPLSEAVAPPAMSRAAGNGESPLVLVMDDEEAIRDLAASMLTHLGYQVATCGDGESAVRLYEAALAAGAPYAAVIMDLTIPGGMGGKEAARQILARHAEARLIVSSGYSHDPIMSDYRLHGFQGVLAKPYKVAELARLLAAVLAEEQTP
ncbi:multi-sensor hybrid histidine kinase [Desulfobulbus propionicus DSM 2032]|uniref:histidine kinase n=2 Tax=Desulfobulbus propionicus TaxID=894 RepID=A0A7U3YK56_DESPD|nr:multi-sensor hybrid histidine kinase [Desulfobulbus propionicus DSM 2032]